MASPRVKKDLATKTRPHAADDFPEVYAQQIAPLLKEMRTTINTLAAAIDTLEARVTALEP